MSRSRKEAAKEGLWVQKAFSKNKGALHRQLDVPEGKKIPQKKLEKAEKSKSPLLRKRANLAEIARNFKHKEGGRTKVDAKKINFKGASRAR